MSSGRRQSVGQDRLSCRKLRTGTRVVNRSHLCKDFQTQEAAPGLPGLPWSLVCSFWLCRAIYLSPHFLDNKKYHRQYKQVVF